MATSETTPRLIVFASGAKVGGGSGFRVLVENKKHGFLDADIAAVVSNHEHGGVSQYAETLGIPFEHFPGPWTAERYAAIVQKYNAQWIALSGWLKLVKGLLSDKTFNIHPGPLPEFGGPGMHGHHVHVAVLESYRQNKITHSAVSMHFVTDEYDKGPIVFQKPVPIQSNDTPDTLGARVNAVEHQWQAFVTNLIIHGLIRWDGQNPESLVVPPWYHFHQRQGW